MKKAFKWKVGDQLSQFGAPSEHCEVKKLVENDTKERTYVIHDAGAPDWRTVPAHELETYWVRSQAFQKKEADKLNFAAHANGMPDTFVDDDQSE